MKQNYLLAALLVAGLGVGQSKADDVKEMTMKAYTDHLLEVYGDTGVIIAGTINGRDKDGHYVTDIFPSPVMGQDFYATPIMPLSMSMAATPCATTQIIIKINSGAYSFPWCAASVTSGMTTYEAQRDTFIYSGGRWTYYVSTFFDCQNSSDLAQMPTAVSLAVCH
jgi:hypothetical protein